MARRSDIDLNKPKLFSPTFTRRLLDQSGAVIQKNAQDLVDSNVDSTSSFRYDPVGVGIKSTQQIPVDFSQFKNHTFFNSAEVNVNVAFDRIINEYPFDGTLREVEAFLDSLTGFEKWVFDNFPRSIGYLFFSGSSGTTGGTYIAVNDFAGFLYPSISKKRTGENILDPGNGSFAIELQLYVPSQANGNQVVCQKISGSQNGITLALSQSQSPLSCSIVFAVSSGSQILSASAPVAKGQFNHVVAQLDRHPGINDIQIYVNEELVATSPISAELGDLGFPTSQLTIGSGTSHSGMQQMSPAIAFTPTQTLSGAIDELRIFHATRAPVDQQLFARKSIYATPELRLYFKFNEPTGSIGNDPLVIDSSGNSLHSLITNYTPSLRSTGSLTCPMTYEKLILSPVLFPAYTGVQSFNEELLASASLYDSLNPNLITKLVPAHYFEEGQTFEGLQSENGTIVDALVGSGPPGTAELGSSQLLASMLYVWAKFFDELKMVLDLFGTVIHVDFDKPGYTADQFLQFVAKYYGFEMPAFFVDSSLEQFIDAENVSDTVSNNTLSLQLVQNQIWRRILTNLGEIIRSKGTLHSVRSLLRSLGVDPDNHFKLREFGGPTFRSLENARDPKAAITTLLDFSGSLTTTPTVSSLDVHGVPSNRPFLKSPFLSGSRVEPGYPEPTGQFTFIASNQPSASNAASDGLYTSGSWTYEGLYRYQTLLSGSHAVTQSLVRFNTTGSLTGPAGSGGLVANLVAISGSGLTLYVAPGYGGSTYPTLSLPLTGADVMNGRLWNVSFGRSRADAVGSFVSASYFLRAARQEFGDIVESYSTSAYFNESGSSPGTINVFEVVSGAINASGTFITIGSQSITQQAGLFLNDPATPSMARSVNFDGQLGQVRFWSLALDPNEWLEHVRNPRSVGVYDPRVNFNFVTSLSGSFQKIRLDVSMEQDVTSSDTNGGILAFDYSQNMLHMTGTGFEVSASIFDPQRIFYSQLSSRFDEASSNNKVRIRSFQDYGNVQLLGGDIAPVYEIPRSEIPNDDVRFSIDFSIMDALDDDIIKIFAALDEFDNALGNPELIFSQDYPSLEQMRDVYFRRLTGKLKIKQFFEFFKWFDSILGISTFIEQLVPRKTKFLGTNFVIESHMLERPRVEYLFNDIYLGENNRHGLKGTILLQQFVGALKKY